MTTSEIKSILFDAFYNEKDVKVVRRCFGNEETCIGLIEGISRRKPPKNRAESELCFSVVASDKWWGDDQLDDLSSWISQVVLIEIVN